MKNNFDTVDVLSSFSSKLMELILLPTEQCNFRCTYCYEDFELGKMEDSTIRGIENLISKRISELKSLRLSWFGGEPLLALGVIWRVLEHAKKECDKHSVQLSGGFTTNGYKLSVELAKRLSEYGQNNYQITLDGFGEVHDQTRISKSGKGTFKKIWTNLIALRDSDLAQLRITIRIHLTQSNHEVITELVDQVKKEFGGDQRFRIHFHRIENLGGNNKVELLSRDVYEERLKELNQRLNGAIESDNELEGNKDGSNYICYAARPNSILIRSNGRLGKCTVALNDDYNDIGFINEDGSLIIDNKKLQPWVRGFDSYDVLDLGCPNAGMNNYLYPQHERIRIVEL